MEVQAAHKVGLAAGDIAPLATTCCRRVHRFIFILVKVGRLHQITAGAMVAADITAVALVAQLDAACGHPQPLLVGQALPPTVELEVAIPILQVVQPEQAGPAVAVTAAAAVAAAVASRYTVVVVVVAQARP